MRHPATVVDVPEKTMVARWLLLLLMLPVASGSPVLDNFGAPHANQTITGATIAISSSTGVEECADRCLARTDCIAFSLFSANCTLSTWSSGYLVQPLPGSAYYTRTIPRHDTPWTPAIRLALRTPTSGVAVGPDSVFGQAFEANIDYLGQYPLDDMLYWFRIRNGTTQPPGKSWGWDNAGFERGFGLHGSVSGLFMMGSGGVLRWSNHTELWATRQGLIGLTPHAYA
eukprot:gene3426-3899_t